MADQDSSKKTCFIITPIGAPNSQIRRKIDGVINAAIKPALGEDFEVIASHTDPDPGTMTKAIIEKIYNSDLVIANLTGNNANVMYELALRHAAAKPVIHITESIKDIPFDVNDQRTIEYVDDMSGVMELRDKLKELIKCINYEESASNPITEALQKQKIVNIPEEIQVDFGDKLKDLANSVESLKHEIAYLRSEKRNEDHNSISDSIKYIDENLYWSNHKINNKLFSSNQSLENSNIKITE